MSCEARTMSGFTLLELLVAMTLMGLLSIALFSGLHFGNKVWETTQSSTADINTIRRFQDFLQSELARTYPALTSNEATQTHVEFSGDDHALTFLAPDPQKVGEMAHITVSSDGQSIDVRIVPELGDNHTAEGRKIRGSMTLSYFGQKPGAEHREWYRDWHDQSRSPSLVRADVRDKSGHTWNQTMALRVEAPADCVFNPLTQDCQER